MLHFLHRHILLPAYESGIKRRKTFAYWRSLEKTQWLSRGELEKIQFTALQNLIRHAFDHCDYYRQAWQHLGLSPSALKSPQDFTAWPIIDRATIRQNRATMRDTRLSLISKSTGGSSGEPLHFDLDHASHDHRTAAWHRGYSWAGAAPGTKQFYLWGTDLTRPNRLKDRLYNHLYRKQVWSCFDLAEQRIGELATELNRARPDVIVAYTKPLFELARGLSERNIKPFSPKSIVVGAEKLYDFERDLIQQVFAAPVFETYGSREFMLIGSECDRHSGLHLTMENLLVEILDASGQPAAPGEEGDVVITDLFNRGMPFVRYLTGDRAVAGFDSCSCGRGLPLLRKVVGRQLDTIRTVDGRLIPGEFFPHLLKDYRAVRRFQVVQESPDFVRLRLVADSDWNETTRAKIDSQIRARLGPAVRFDIEQLKEIPLSNAGKLQVVINKTQYRRAG